MGDLLLLRHCESTGQAPDAPLTPAGARAAGALVDSLRALSVDHVVTSPYLRARHSVEPFAAACGHSVRVDARLRERALATEQIEDFEPELMKTWRDLDYRLPGGETSREAQARGRAALDAVAAEVHHLAILATHGNLLTLMLHSIDSSYGFDSWRALTNPDLFLLSADGQGSFGIEHLGAGV